MNPNETKMIRSRNLGGLFIQLDASQIHPNDPGRGCPVLVYRGGHSATFCCAVNEGELCHDRAGLVHHVPVMNTLISAQQTAIDALLAAPEQTEAAASFGRTVLNRKARTVGAICRRFRAGVVALGFSDTQSWVLWQDAVDVAKLEHVSR